MKITNVDIVASNSSNIVNLSFRDPTSQNPYNAKDILGLDADEIISKYYGSGLLGANFYELSLKNRNIVLKIGLNPNFSLGKSYSDLRDDLYKFISASRTGEVQLRFKNGNVVVAAISGFIKKFESPNFTKTPEVQITIDCSDNLLRALDEVDVNLFGLLTTNTTVNDEKSTAPHGFRFGIEFLADIVNFSVQDAPVAKWAFEVDLTGTLLEGFVIGDELHFSSEANNKYLFMIRNGAIIHLVDRILPGSVWPIIFPGINTFICSENVRWTYISYFPTYWGV